MRDIRVKPKEVTMFIIVCQDDGLEVRAVYGPFDEQEEAMRFMQTVPDWGEFTLRTILPVQSRAFVRGAAI